MIWGALPLRLSYSEVTVDEPGKGEGTQKGETFSSEQLYNYTKTSGMPTLHFFPSPLNISSPSLRPPSLSASLSIPAMNNP